MNNADLLALKPTSSKDIEDVLTLEREVHPRIDIKKIKDNIALLSLVNASYPPAEKIQSIKYLYRIGHGPSSSHSIGPERAAKHCMDKLPRTHRVMITLYGSLAATGKGHFTDVAMIESFERCGLVRENIRFTWKPHEELPLHPNGLTVHCYDEDDTYIGFYVAYSIGGGSIFDNFVEAGGDEAELIKVRPPSEFEAYPHTRMWGKNGIMKFCEENKLTSFPDYARHFEKLGGYDVEEHCRNCWNVMKAAVETGLTTEGYLTVPGNDALKVCRKAKYLNQKAARLSPKFRRTPLLMSYATAVSEVNAGREVPIVTSPTCGAAGVLPGVLYYFWKEEDHSEKEIIDAMLTAAVFGNLVKANASVSGAELGCMAEVGVASAMAAAAACQLLGGDMVQIESAFETSLEGAMGLTCDTVAGGVLAPCISRNGLYACHAVDSALMALTENNVKLVSCDEIILTMKVTGVLMHSDLKETARGGLALTYCLDEVVEAGENGPEASYSVIRDHAIDVDELANNPREK